MRYGSARYSYEWIRGLWYVYDHERCCPVECFIKNREEARKRCFELNGWNYRPRQTDK